MSSKEEFCYSILKKYSMLVDFEGTPHRETVPAPRTEDNETYKQWKDRVLGSNVSDVTLYAPIVDPASQTRITTLQSQAGANHLEKMFKSLAKTKEKQRKIAVNAAVDNTEQKYESFSKEVLEDVLAEFDGVLEPSVVEFFQRPLNGANLEIDTVELIRALIKVYNSSVCQYRERNL